MDTKSQIITEKQIDIIKELLVDGLRKSGFENELVRQVLETRGDQLTRELVDVIRRHVYAVAPVRQVVMVVLPIVRDPRAIEEKVKEGFSRVNSDITSQNFSVAPLDGPAPGEAILVKFGKLVSSEKVIGWLEKMGLRFGLPTELVDLGKCYSPGTELDEYLPVVALGDLWFAPNGARLGVGLDSDASGRRLELVWWAPDFDRQWSFLAFRE